LAISVDYTGARFCINVPQADLTLVSGTLYTHDTDAFWDEMKAWEASEIGIVFEDMQSHNAAYTVFGITYAPKVEILNETNSSNVDLYQVCYIPDTAYSVRLEGSNNNIADIQNTILKNTTTQVIPGNAAGLIGNAKIDEIHGGVQRKIWVDTTLGTDGSGYQGSPHNNFTSAIDNAEANGITDIVLLADATADRQLKNFIFEGIGSPVLTLNGQDFKGSKLIDIELEGTMVSTGEIHAVDCILRNNVTGIYGRFDRCGLAGDIVLKTASDSDFVGCYSTISGLSRPSVSANGGACDVSIRGFQGGLTVKGMTDASGTMSVGMAQGRLNADTTNTAGTISVRGRGDFTDNTAGATVDTSGFLEVGKVDEMHIRQDLNAAKQQKYADDGSVISNDDFTLTKTDNGDGTFDVVKS